MLFQYKAVLRCMTFHCGSNGHNDAASTSSPRFCPGCARTPVDASALCPCMEKALIVIRFKVTNGAALPRSLTGERDVRTLLISLPPRIEPSLGPFTSGLAYDSKVKKGLGVFKGGN